MCRKHVLSLVMMSSGVALLVAATTVGVASSATGGLRGGTLRISQSGGAFDTLDPQLAYVSNDWDVLHSTQLLLVNLPDKAGPAGSQPVPEAASAFPTISNHGRTVTFQLRSGLRFSDCSPVTAASYERPWERLLSPKMYAQYGIFDGLNKMVVGADAFTKGKATHISGIRANGLTLTFHLTKPNPTFISILSIPWFGAEKPNMPYWRKTSSGVLKYPSAGPYYIAANRPGHVVVLKRNPYYHGSRPANPNEIVINSYPNSNGETSLLQIERNQVDFDMAGIPATDVQTVAKNYPGQFHVGTESCTIWWALNSARPPTNDVNVRKALNYAIGRTPIVNLLGPDAATPTDQILEPGVPGYEKLSLYGNYPNVAKAKAVGGSALNNAPPLNIPYDAGSVERTDEAELIQSEAEQIGLTANLVPQSDSGPSPFETNYSQDNLVRSGFCLDYFDAFDLVNVLFDRSRSGGGLSGFHYFTSPALTRQARHAASLSGKARARAYGALDRLLMAKYAPVLPVYIPNFRYLTSKRVHNVVFSHYLGYPVLNAMSVG